MKKLILLIMTIGFTCQAQLGKTKEQCEKLYGTPNKSQLHNGMINSYYSRNGYIVVIVYINNACHGITFFNGKTLTETEINNFLKQNRSVKWTKISNGFWKNNKGDFAVIQTDKSLRIITNTMRIYAKKYK